MVGNTTTAAEVAEETTVSLYMQGCFHIPAEILSNKEIAYNDEVRVTVATPDAPSESVTFTNFVNSANNVTIPSEVRDMVDLGVSKTIDVTIEKTGKTWSPEDGGRKDYRSNDEQTPTEEIEIKNNDLEKFIWVEA